MNVSPYRVWMLCVVFVSGVACDAPPATKAPSPTPPVVDAPQAPLRSCEPLEQLARMDTRQPVPLQPMMAWHQKQNMMEHLVAIQRITGALAREDWEGVTTASALIGSSPQMKQMCQHMGAGASGFTELALEFHRRADQIGVFARAKDGPGVLQATSDTLQTCTSCHATFRQDVVSAKVWEQRTGSSHVPSAHHGGH